MMANCNNLTSFHQHLCSKFITPNIIFPKLEAEQCTTLNVQKLTTNTKYLKTSKFSSLIGSSNVWLLYSEQKNEFLKRKPSEDLFLGGLLNCPIKFSIDCELGEGNFMLGTMNSSMSTEVV